MLVFSRLRFEEEKKRRRALGHVEYFTTMRNVRWEKVALKIPTLISGIGISYQCDPIYRGYHYGVDLFSPFHFSEADREEDLGNSPEVTNR